MPYKSVVIFLVLNFLNIINREAFLEDPNGLYFQEVHKSDLIPLFILEIAQTVLQNVLIQGHESYFEDRVNHCKE